MSQPITEQSQSTGLGRTTINPGIMFTDADNVIPDVVWVSNERLAILLDDAGHLTAAPASIVEVLSPGDENERLDREAKLKLYSYRGIQEYWIVDWCLQQIEVYRREQAALKLAATLFGSDELTCLLLPGLASPITRPFA